MMWESRQLPEERQGKQETSAQGSRQHVFKSSGKKDSLYATLALQLVGMSDCRPHTAIVITSVRSRGSLGDLGLLISA